MNFDGLRAIVSKEEIVPTRQARDFLDNSQDIDDLYKHHVRTYIPLQSGSDEASGVGAFATRFIKQVKELRSPRGYITGDFGYGKTSAGLFVWKKAQDARLVAVPPFKLNRLEDLLDATAGWVVHVLSKTVPTLVDQAVGIYELFHNRGLKTIAERYGVTTEQAERMYADQALQLTITPRDIVRFFEQMTALVLEAGFEGLVVIPDELQQYLEPEIKSGKIDPLGPFFDIITELMNHQGKLAFGFLMIITSKELGVINDQRGDLIDRLRGNTLDLRAIYDREFPARLWALFAETFDYSQISKQIVDEYTLECLGQIASRQDLSNGPRTVINAFRQIAFRALETNGNIAAYTPIDLVEDFLANRIAFDARKLLQEVTNKALAASFVRGNSLLERAVKLLAAFPVDGATREIQFYYDLGEACAELKASGSPELVVEIGDRHHPSLALRALDVAQENTDELSLVLREFVRNYEAQAANQMQRAVNSFMMLLGLIFKSEQWSTSKLEMRNFARNAEAVYIGAFSEMAKRFPERIVHVRVMGDDEEFSDTKLDGECHLTFELHRHLDVSKHQRQAILGELQSEHKNYSAWFSLNIMLPCFDNLNRATQDQLRRVVDVEDVTIMLVLALHAYLLDAADRDTVSKPLKEMIKRSMSVRLLEGALEVLFNPSLGSSYKVNGGLIVEKIVSELIESRYGDQYETLITYKQWRDNLRSYITVLRQLDSFAQKQGFALLEGTKDEIARYFGTAASTFDAFQSRFPDLLKIEGGTFPSRREQRKGGILLTRHSLEEIILSSLNDAPTIPKRDGIPLRALKIDVVYGGAADMGYRRDEIEFILDIMKARDLITIEGGWIEQYPRPIVSIEQLSEQIRRLKQNADLLHAAVRQPDTELIAKRAERYTVQLKEAHKHHKEGELLVLDEQIQSDLTLLEVVVKRELGQLKERVDKLQLSDLPQDWASILNTAISAGTFTTTLNKVRLHYVQMSQNWNNEASVYRGRLSECIVELTNIDLTSLQRFVGRVNLLTENHLKLNDQRRMLGQSVQQTSAWQSLANELYKLLDAIEKQGEPARDLRVQLQEIERKIEQEFQRQASEAFGTVERYQSQLSKLKQQFTDLADQSERKFARDQEQYRSLFIQKARINPEKLWQKIIYSPSNPNAIYNNLYQSVEGQSADLLDELSGLIEKSNTHLYAARSFFAPQTNIDMKAIEMQLKAIDAEIRDINDAYTQMTATVQKDIRIPERFALLLDNISEAKKRIQAVGEALRQLREPAQRVNLTPDEQRILDILSNSGEATDLVRLRQTVRHLNEDAFWSVVRLIWEKQLVEINMKRQ